MSLEGFINPEAPRPRYFFTATFHFDDKRVLDLHTIHNRMQLHSIINKSYREERWGVVQFRRLVEQERVLAVVTFHSDPLDADTSKSLIAERAAAYIFDWYYDQHHIPNPVLTYAGVRASESGRDVEDVFDNYTEEMKNLFQAMRRFKEIQPHDFL